jgi:hypothetical protein
MCWPAYEAASSASRRRSARDRQRQNQADFATAVRARRRHLHPRPQRRRRPQHAQPGGPRYDRRRPPLLPLAHSPTSRRRAWQRASFAMRLRTTAARCAGWRSSSRSITAIRAHGSRSPASRRWRSTDLAHRRDLPGSRTRSTPTAPRRRCRAGRSGDQHGAASRRHVRHHHHAQPQPDTLFVHTDPMKWLRAWADERVIFFETRRDAIERSPRRADILRRAPAALAIGPVGQGAVGRLYARTIKADFEHAKAIKRAIFRAADLPTRGGRMMTRRSHSRTGRRGCSRASAALRRT